jgi:hypothetical protein
VELLINKNIKVATEIVLLNPVLLIAINVSVHCKKRHSDRLTKEFLLHKDRKEK